MLAAAKKGRDPYKADAAARRKPAQRSQVDPDMELVGQVVKEAESYVVRTTFATAAAVSVPLMFVRSLALSLHLCLRMTAAVVQT